MNDKDKKQLKELGVDGLIDLVHALIETASAQSKKIDELSKELNDLKLKSEAAEDQSYIDTWNKDMDNFHSMAYGDPTPEEGGIRDCSFDSIRYNEAGEPDGYC